MATTAIAMRTKYMNDTTGTTTINYVNPEATSAQLQSLASAFNNLTTNTIVDVTRIDKQVLGSEIAKLPRNMKFYKGNGDTKVEATSINSSELATNLVTEPFWTLEYDGGGNFSNVATIPADSFNPIAVGSSSDTAVSGTMLVIAKGENATTTGGITFLVPESATHQAGELTIPVTAS